MLVFSVLIVLLFSPLGLLARLNPRPIMGWLLALVPLGLFTLFCTLVPAVTEGVPLAESYAWVPQMGLSLSFRLDGLSLLFALLVSGIGTLIVLYTAYYLKGDPGMGRFYLALLIFLGSMLGLVLAENVLTMFIFWELTSVSSYLLVGYKHDYPEVRRGAQQGLLITVGGGLALVVGLLLLGTVAGSYEISAIIAAGDQLRASSLYTPALLLIAAGCFTKSAQFPFHFWLPNAMQAPTPASAFLHSATMVKAGIYLLARLHPAMSGTALWTGLLVSVGAFTMLLGAVSSLRKNDIKALLAFSTISQLGVLTMLAGLPGHYAEKALVTGILAHALYKGSLFMAAGVIDHEAGTRDLRVLGGLWGEMKITALLMIVAALSMAGIPILFGFLAKETLLKAAVESTLDSTVRTTVLVAIVVSASFGIAAAWRLIHGTFFGPKRGELAKKHIHEAPLGMLIGPGLPALLSLVLSLGLLPFVSELLAPAATAVAGEAVKVELLLWEGLNLPVVLSGLAILLGIGLARFERTIVEAPSPLPGWLGADRIYDATITGMLDGATAFTRTVQSGKLRIYILCTFGALALLTGPIFVRYGMQGMAPPGLGNASYYEILAALGVLAGVIATISARSRLGAIISTSVVGAMVALLFIVYSAPDLALTQLLIEALSTVFLLLVFAVLPPRFEWLSSNLTRARDGAVAIGIGLLMAGLTYTAGTSKLFPSIASFYKAESLPEAKGANVVNVIIVDFRGFDTQGEITVLFIALLGIYGLLRLRRTQRGTLRPSDIRHTNGNGSLRPTELEFENVKD